MSNYAVPFFTSRYLGAPTWSIGGLVDATSMGPEKDPDDSDREEQEHGPETQISSWTICHLTKGRTEQSWGLVERKSRLVWSRLI